MTSSNNEASSLKTVSQLRVATDALLAEVGGLLADLLEAPQTEDDEGARHVIDTQLQRFWQSYYDLKRRHEENTLSVAMLALTKSGKSTLLNALMGREVLPMNNVPETARICRIVHNPATCGPGAEPLLLADGPTGRDVRGEAAVRARLQELNSAARNSSPAGADLLHSLQRQASASANANALAAAHVSPAGGSGSGAGAGGGGGGGVLHIHAPLVALEGCGADSGLGRVVLLDTPGPNEAGEEQLKFQVERLLEGVDCVLYLLDYTKLKTAEEEGLFRRLRAINPQLVERLSSRLFFVINKVDACETSEGLDPDEVRAYVADLVTRQMGAAAQQYHQQQQAPLSPAPSAGAPGLAPAPSWPMPARSGSGAGLTSYPSSPPAASVMAAGAAFQQPQPQPLRSPGPGFGPPSSPGAASSAATVPTRFRLHPDQVLLLSARNALLSRLVLGGRASPDALKKFSRLAFGAFGLGAMGRAGPSQEQIRSAAAGLLESSGVPELEARVLSFLGAHAAAVKMLATLDDCVRLLEQVRNVALACHACLSRNAEELRHQAEGLRAELAEVAAAFEGVRGRADALTHEVVGEIRSHLALLRGRLFSHILQTLEPDARAPPPPAAATAPASRWSRVREKFLSMFTSTTTTLAGGAAAGGAAAGCSAGVPVPAARSRSRDELAALLVELHEELMGQIHAEVHDFWGVLEAVAASRHHQLLADLNTHLAALARRVEGAVSERLAVPLAPADIRLRPPSLEQLHGDVQELIEKGIRESNEKHIRVASRTTLERVQQRPPGPSLCRWGGYWVEVPRTRTVVETYTATVYALQPEEIQNHFTALVDGAVTASERALGATVGALVEQQVAAARQRIEEYGSRYLDAMTASLAASDRGAQFREAALKQVSDYLARLDGLTARAAEVQAAAAAGVPDDAAGLMDDVEVLYDTDDEEAGGQYGAAYGTEEQLAAAGVADERAEEHEQHGEEDGAAEQQVTEGEEEEGAQDDPDSEYGSGDGGGSPRAEASGDWRSAGEEEAEQQEGGEGEGEAVVREVQEQPSPLFQSLLQSMMTANEGGASDGGTTSGSSGVDKDGGEGVVGLAAAVEVEVEAAAAAAGAGGEEEGEGNGVEEGAASEERDGVLVCRELEEHEGDEREGKEAEEEHVEEGEEEHVEEGQESQQQHMQGEEEEEEEVPELDQLVAATVEETETREAVEAATSKHEPQAQATGAGAGADLAEAAANTSAADSAPPAPRAASPPAPAAPAAAPPSAPAPAAPKADPGRPFDYGAAFLHAMSSSELVAGGSEGEGEEDGGGEGREGLLTMIPLSPAGSPPGGRGGAGGVDSPRSAGGSEDWQLVAGEEAAEAEGAQGGR